MKKNFIFAFLMLLCSLVHGQETQWGDVVNSNFANNMTITSSIYLDGVQLSADNYEVGVFCNDELRGLAAMEYSATAGEYRAFISVYGESGNSFSFKLYNSNTNTEYVISNNSLAFDDDGVGTVMNPYAIKFLSVATTAIGEVKYATLSEAITAAQNGETIELLGNITEDVTINKAVTIDGKEFTYTGKMTAKADVTVKNLNFDGKGYNGYAFETRGANYVTIEDCTAKNYGYGFVQLASGTALTTVKDVTVTNVNYGVKVDYSNAVVLENVDITAAVAAVLNSNYGEKTITIKDSELSILGTWKRNETVETTYVFEGTNTIGSFAIEEELDNFKLAAGATLTAPNDIEMTAVESGYCVKYEDGMYFLATNMVKNTTTGETYATLSGALAAAQNGETIELLENITENVTISKNVTINGAGKTYTGLMTLNNVNATIQNVAFVKGQVYKHKTTGLTANVTVKECSFDGQGLNEYALNIGGGTSLLVEDCTAQNYGYGFIQVASAISNITVKDVEVTNVNYGLKIDYAGAVSVENANIDAAVAALLNSNYGEKTFTIKNSNLSILGTWKRNDTVKTTYVFEGNNTVGSFIIEAGLDIIQLAAGATLTSPSTNAIEMTAVEDDYYVEYENGVYYLESNVVKNATTGETYATLAAALAAAQNGETIELLDNITEDVTINKAVTINGAGKTYTGKMTAKADLTVKNVNFDGKGYNGYAVETRGANYLTVEECTAKNYGYGFVQLASGTALTTVKNVTVTNVNYGVKVDYSNAVVIENVNITAAEAAVLNSNYGEKTITIKNSSLSILGTWKRNDTVETTYVFEGANTIGSFVIEAALDNFQLAEGATLTAPNDIEMTAAEAGYVKYENGMYFLATNMVKNATTGEIYATLSGALEAAQNGETIELLDNITEDVTINTAVTIDGKEFTYTGKMTAKADVTVKNLNFDGKGYNGYAFETRGANYVTIEDCTAKDYGYGFVQLASGTALTTVKNVTVTNVNYGVKVDYSNAVVLENVDITAAVAAVLNSNYGEKTITIKNSNLSILGTWKRNETVETTYVFEGANTIGSFAIEEELDNFQLAAGATLTAPNEITVTAVESGYSVKYEDGMYFLATNMVKNATTGETYATLSGALAAAQNGNTIELLDNITEDVTISKNVTINGAGKTYTGKMTAKADVTVKNLNFDGKGYNGYAFETRGANYVTIEDCTAANYGYGFVQLASGTALTTVKDVTVTNVNYGVKVDYSNAVVLENVNITAAVAAVLNSNYGEKTITIKNSSLSILGTWKRNDTVETTYVFEGANTIGSFVIEAALDNFQLATGATLTAPNAIEMTAAEAGYYVEYEDGVYFTVESKQVQTLAKGWNWYSSYINISGEEGLRTLENALGDNGTTIKKNGSFVEYDANQWIENDDFNSVSVEEMYMINVIDDTDIQIVADFADPTTEITIKKGWNWISYPVSESVNFETALAELANHAQDGDRIKSRNNGYLEYVVNPNNGNEGWDGSMNSFVPGQGYMYYSNSETEYSFSYTMPEAKEEARPNVTAENNYWVPNTAAFSDNMTITAVLNIDGNMMKDDFEVAAFVNGEVRGSARPVFVESAGQYMLFLTIYGEGNEELTFKCYDIYSDEEYSLNDRLVYSGNAMIGSINEPFMLNLSTMGIGENNANTISVYPNPTTANTAISFETTCDMVEVFNALGAKVAEYRNVETINGMEAAGVYLIRVTNDNAVQNCRLIVK